ncbi:MAG: DUF5668 domain-containing protein [Anaerolineaceae bacterium]|jgi:hypothetical protein
MDRRTKRRGLFFPLLLVGLGVFLLLINLEVISGTTRENFLLYWPVLLILAGLDGLWRQEGLAWSLVILGLGVLLLLGNLGYLAVRALPLLSKIWPILLVAIGIDIAFGRQRGGWRWVLHAGVGILAVGLIFWLALAFPVAVGTHTVNFEQPLDEAQAVRIDFDLIVGKLALTNGVDNDQLLFGSAVLPRYGSLRSDYTEPVNGKSILRLGIESGNQPLAGDQTAYAFDFKVNPRIPVDVRTKLVVGELQLYLRNTLTTNLETEVALGSQNLTIPCTDRLDVEIEQALGFVTVNIPRGCGVTIHLDNALVNTRLPAGWQREGSVVTSPDISAGGSEVDIRIGVAVGTVSINLVD